MVFFLVPHEKLPQDRLLLVLLDLEAAAAATPVPVFLVSRSIACRSDDDDICLLVPGAPRSPPDARRPRSPSRGRLGGRQLVSTATAQSAGKQNARPARTCGERLLLLLQRLALALRVVRLARAVLAQLLVRSLLALQTLALRRDPRFELAARAQALLDEWRDLQRARISGGGFLRRGSSSVCSSCCSGSSGR